MKNLKQIIAAFCLVSSCFFIQSCEDKNMSPDEKGSAATSDSATKKKQGTLVFKVITPTDMPVSDVMITINARQANAIKEQDGFSMQKTTDLGGMADFGELENGTYFYIAVKKGHHHPETETETRTGYVIVRSDNNTTRVVLTFN
ncbi:MAG: hypothetical protein IAF38_05250 [Bacteroidia bacterium]|nr:hypothetical protein [Bacteroidia bacterium]